MAHLYNNHAVTITNPDDEDFSDYLSQSDILTNIDYLAPIISPDERVTLQNAIAVHQNHHDATVHWQFVDAHRWRLIKDLA
jgi:hypothetical protein